MNKITKLFSVLFVIFVVINNAKGQEIKRCATTEMQLELFNSDPQLYQDYLKESARLEAIDKEAYLNGYENVNRANTVYIIPVVFHIIHQFGSENISDAQIKDAIKMLTEHFRNLSADTANTLGIFKSLAGDSEIEFRLAQKDPNGNGTNGIDRIVSSKTVCAGTTVSSRNASKLNPWPASNYLNIWTVKSFEGGIAGYAQFPGGGPAATDGIMVLSNYIGSIGTSSPSHSYTLSHEAGHYFSLCHIWDCYNGMPFCGTDNITDTPQTAGHDNTCATASACNTGVAENAQNIMDYSYCYTMFTKGQSAQMRAVLDPSNGSRKSLCTTTNLTTNTGVNSPGVLCQAEFTASFLPNTNNTICQGTGLTFTDDSWNGIPTSWSWSFPGGTPSTASGTATPVIQYNSAGVYDVSLTVSNISGTKSTTKTAFVVVNSSAAIYANAIYTESFEGAAIPNIDWQVRTQLPGGNTWIQTSAAAATGVKSVQVQNSLANNTYSMDLIGPSIDMTKITGVANMTFKVAHAQKAATGLGSADKLEVYASTNCGKSWTLRKVLSGVTLSTAGVNSSWTTPAATQWATQSVNLLSYTSQTNLYFMFRFTSNGGNNVYIDDINIGTSSIGEEEELSSSISFNIYPNPAEANTLVGFNLLNKQSVQIRLYDVLGQEVSTIYEGTLNAGEHSYPIGSHGNLSSGIYFVKLLVVDKEFTKKLIVK